MKKICAGSTENWKVNNLLISCSFNMNCNLKCSYCINRPTREIYIKNNEIIEKHTLLQLIEDLSTLKKDSFSFAVAGGEPSLYPHLFEFYKYVNDNMPNRAFIFISTNGSLLKRFIPCIEASPNIRSTICISMHIEQLSMEHYKKILADFPYPEFCRLKIMLEPGRLHEVQNILDFSKALGYTDYHVQILIINGKVHSEYSKEEIALFQSHEHSSPVRYFNKYINDGIISETEFCRDDFVLDPDLVNYKGMRCLAGHSAIRILPDGSVTYCYRDYSKNIFSIKNQSILEYPFLSGSVRCEADRCVCYTTLPKWNPEFTEAPEYFIVEQKQKEDK